jgi:hypothetical protein
LELVSKNTAARGQKQAFARELTPSLPNDILIVNRKEINISPLKLLYFKKVMII